MTSLISQYAKDFNRLDAEAIADWYEYPLSILNPKGNTIFSSHKEFTESVEKLLTMYRSFDFSYAEILQETTIKGKHGLDQVDVSWRLFNNKDKPIIDFDITYFCKLKDTQTRLCGVVSHNEFSEWQKKLKG